MDRTQKGNKMVIKAKYQGASHVSCPEQEEAPYRLGGGSGYGCRGWQKGQTMKSSERHIADGWPEYVTVVSSSREYVREDGMSFGVGDESGYYYSARCREATGEEAAPVRERIAKANRARRLTEIKNIIREAGERPDVEHSTEGKRYFDSQNIYGGGDWLVVGPEWIWYVRNNGMDGDNWAANNVRTGGAGAIGWRVPRTEELAEEIVALAAAMDGGKPLGG
jgi:hypothetical protein